MKTIKCELCGTKIEERYAYAAVILPRSEMDRSNYPYGIGKAVVGTLGYTRARMGMYRTYEQAQDRAAELNKELGLSEMEAWEIIMRTMWKVK